MAIKYNIRDFIILFFLALLLRTTLFFIIQPYKNIDKLISSDAEGYNKIAIGLIEGRGYAPDDPFLSMIRTPGYPAIIALIYFIFGVHPYLVILFQVMIDSLLAVIIYKVILILFNEKSAFIGGLLWAIEPFALIYTNQVVSDSIFVFFIVLFFYYFVKFFVKNKIKSLVVSAVLLGIAVYIRPIGIYLAIPFAVLIFLGKKDCLIIRSKYALIFLLLSYGILFPWIIRNKLMHKHYFFSISMDYNSLVLYSVPVLASKMNMDIKEIQNTELKQQYIQHGELYKKDPYQYYQHFKKRSIDITKANKIDYLRSFYKGILDLFFSVERKNFENIAGINGIEIDGVEIVLKNGVINTIKIVAKHFNKWTIIYCCFVLILLMAEYFLSIIGLIRICFQKKIIICLLILLPIIYFSVIVGPAGLGRFKLPIIPFYLLFVSIFKTPSSMIKCDP